MSAKQAKKSTARAAGKTEKKTAGQKPATTAVSVTELTSNAAPEAEAARKPETAPKTESAAVSKPREALEAKTAAPSKVGPKPGSKAAPAPDPTPASEPELPQPRRSIAFIGSECYPFVKTGGLGDVMYALPKALAALNCDIKVILPKYACIAQEYKDKMVYRGAFDMDLCSDGRRFYVGIMEYVWDGVVYDFIDNEEFFSKGNPYTNLIDDIPTFCFFGKAALAALNYMDWIPDIIHCHDWQAGLVPIYLRTMFAETPLARSKTVITIHNLRFQGVYNIPTIRYWSNLPHEVFNMGALQQAWTEANMLKGGLSYADMITTVSGTYAAEIQTAEYGEGLDAHLRHHAHKLRGIVNGIDYGMWDPATDQLLEAPYDSSNVIERKRANKLALQGELGLEQDEGKFVIGLISRLTNQKGLDLVSAIVPGLIDGNTHIVVLGTGDAEYENSFRSYENGYRGQVCANIMYDEERAHRIYAGSDALLVPSKFEPCGLTQLIAMRYGTVPVVRETGGLKDTVQPYNRYENDGNGFTFDRYEAGLLYDAINRAKTLYFEDRDDWDQMVRRDMEKDVSWANSAQQYRWLYLELTH
ncbi:glycosyltransferase [Coriobacteriales bacterium OH1046]|nr:glycosyltransferase [Coriobacteriales bacterium OH1046]